MMDERRRWEYLEDLEEDCFTVVRGGMGMFIL